MRQHSPSDQAWLSTDNLFSLSEEPVDFSSTQKTLNRISLQGDLLALQVGMANPVLPAWHLTDMNVH